MVLEWASKAVGSVVWLVGRIIFGPPKKKPKDNNDKRPPSDNRYHRLEDKENVTPQDKFSVPNDDPSQKITENDRSKSPNLTNGVVCKSPLEEPLREIQNEIDATFKVLQKSLETYGAAGSDEESLVAMGMSTSPPLSAPREEPKAPPSGGEVTSSRPDGDERTFSHQVTSLADGRAEVTQETLHERCGDTELFSQRRHEVEQRTTSPFGGPAAGGGGGGEGGGGVGDMFQLNKVSSSSRTEATWNPPVENYTTLNGTQVSKEMYSSSQVSSSSFSSSITSSSQHQQQVIKSLGGSSEAPVIPIAPPPPLSDKQRPMSMPPLDFNILDAIEKNKITLVGGEKRTQQQQITTTKQTSSSTRTTTSARIKDGHSINATDEESRRFQMLMKAFQPPQDEGELILLQKKKMFSSSSFYDEPKHIYPTVQEQVKLCKSIADSLSCDTNRASRGATMYIKRMNRSNTWIHEGPDPTSSEEVDSSEYEPTTPEVKGPEFKPQLKLVLDPRQLQDAMKLSKTGFYNEHNVVSPDICFDLVRDLNSPTGKGAQLFAKRKKKSEKWVVDEESVKEAVKEAAAKYVALTDVMQPQPMPQQQMQPLTPFGSTLPPAPRNAPANQLQELQDRLNPKVKLIKSPWEAALESPSGCVDSAFEMIKKSASRASAMATVPHPYAPSPPPLMVNVGAATVPADMRLYSPRPFSPAPVQQQPTTARSNSPYYPSSSAVYKPKTPKGWIGNAGDQSMYYAPSSWGGQESPSFLDTSYSSDMMQEQQQQASSYQRFNMDSLPNYNNVARAWGSSQRSRGFRPVRPSSAVYGQ